MNSNVKNYLDSIVNAYKAKIDSGKGLTTEELQIIASLSNYVALGTVVETLEDIRNYLQPTDSVEEEGEFE